MKVSYRFQVARQGKRQTIDVETPIEDAPKRPTVSRKARQLALAYYVERAVENGLVASYAEAARRLGVSRARVTQVMNLLLMPVDEQEGVLLDADVGHGTT